MSARDAGPPAGVEQPTPPTLRVVGADAAAEEIAALLAVIGARSGAAATAEQGRPEGWADRAGALRSPLPRGPEAWRMSARPTR